MADCGGTSSPQAPDYRAAAQETAAGNLAAARYATQANRPTQITPYGTSTWTQGAPTRTFNQQRYDDAVRQAVGNDPMALQAIAASGGSVGSVDRNDDRFYDMTPSDTWTQTVSLTPQAQQTLDKQLNLSNRYADLASTGLDMAYSTLADPTLNMSAIPQRAINQGQTAQQAILARLEPQFAQREQALRTQLQNQGIPIGSEAANNEFRMFNQGRNDAEMQAGLFGIGLDNQNRATALQEQAYLQDRPLNLINALRTGAQVQNPQFSNFAQQQTTAGPNFLGAADAQYGAALDATNAQNASSNGLMGGLFALGGAALGSPWLGGALGFPVADAAMLKKSDRRLKSDIVRIGTHPLGIGVYEYTIGGVRDVGVMADEVESVKPSAVIAGADGFKLVNYGEL